MVYLVALLLDMGMFSGWRVPEQVKAVVYPVAPLFDMDANNGAGALRPLCIKALKRIFHMCDRDKVPPLPAHLSCCRGQHAGCRMSSCGPEQPPVVPQHPSMPMRPASRTCAACIKGEEPILSVVPSFVPAAGWTCRRRRALRHQPGDLGAAASPCRSSL